MMRPVPKPGDFITGAAHPADDPRRRGIYKGKFLTSDAPASVGGVQFGSVGPYSPEQVSLGVAEIVRRLRFVKSQLDDQTRSIRKQRDARR